MARRRALAFRQRRLARALERLRDRSGLTIEEICEKLDWSPTKQSRIENAEVGVKVQDIERLLEVYDVSDEERESLMALGRTAKKGWWETYTIPDPYASYIEVESDAAELRCYDAQIINGLFQTKAYALETLAVGAMALLPQPEVERRLEVRMTRQRLLTRKPIPMRVQVVLDEAALTRPIGTPSTMREQYHRLLEIAELDNVILQVLPYISGAHPATGGTFTIVDFEEPYGPAVVFTETLARSIYLEDDRDVHWHTIAFSKLQVEALGSVESKAFISELAKQLPGR